MAEPRQAVQRRTQETAPDRFTDVDWSPRLRLLSRLPADQQPPWQGHPDLACIRAELAAVPALVDHKDIRALREALARAETGAAYLLHVGECAELFSMATPGHIAQRAGLYRRMADRLAERTGREVVLLGRIAGQHAKPRSSPIEVLSDGTELPVYRGDAVNRTEPASDQRRADPWRLLTSYDLSHDTLGRLAGPDSDARPLYATHEALLRDYEEPLTRGGDVLYAGSGHLVWIGDRTRSLWTWHIQWASAVANPVGVKIGPTTTSYEIVDLVHALNLRQERGRLSLISRMGEAELARQLPPLARAVAETGCPVVWQCDPMHGNTRKHGSAKVRLLPHIKAEISSFVRIMRDAGCHPAGLHLEVTPDPVQECLDSGLESPATASRPPCDPRLNPDQAMAVVDHFAAEVSAHQ